jgi:hypothetical protein
MSKKYILFSFLLGLLFACGEKNESSVEQETSNEWELVILDSIQVDYLGSVSGGEFLNGKGVISDFKSNTRVEFDDTGKILYQKTYPIEGPDKVYYPSQLRYNKEGVLYAASFISWLYEFNPDLSLKKEIKLSFLSESKDGGGFLRNLAIWKNFIIAWYPGRDGANPYGPFFFRDHYLLEKINPATGDSEPIIRIPENSRYASDKYFERPWVQFGVTGDYLFLTLSNEPKVHTYDMSQGGKFINTVDFKPSKFLDNGEHSEKYQYINGSKMRDGEIRQFFSTPEGNIVLFSEGINEEIFAENELNTRENFRKQDDFQKLFIKIVQRDSTLSNEIEITQRIGRILNIESVSKPFYALRNDEYLGEEQDYITFYKLQLVKK